MAKVVLPELTEEEYGTLFDALIFLRLELLTNNLDTDKINKLTNKILKETKEKGE